MELIKALKICLELAEQNIINDGDMPLEMLDQWHATQTLSMHIQELENPSPIVIVSTPYSEFSNVPASLFCVDVNHNREEIKLDCNPELVAQFLNEGNKNV